MASTSRRDAIRLAASVGIAGIGAAAAKGTVVTVASARDAWNSRVTNYHALSLRFSDHCDGEPCLDDPAYPDWQGRSGVLCEEHETVLHNLLEEPAPDTAALAEKIAIYESEFGADAPLTSLLHDALRLAGSGAR
ncbi:MAG: hypothetical protein ACTHKR_13705 [Sphingomonas sp.]